jgi:hypothetical protein
LLYPAELQAQILFVLYCSKQTMERVMGIEPTQSAWKAEILPLNYTRKLKSALALSLRTFKIITVIAIFVNSFFKKILGFSLFHLNPARA